MSVSVSVCASCSHEFLNFYLSRILIQSMEQFNDQQSMVTWHIPSEFSKEMSCKSEVVRLYAYTDNNIQ